MTWETVPLGEVASLNPRNDSTTEPGTFLGMADVSENGTTSSGIRVDPGDLKSGYTPFRDRDILVAKITPCFENGKIAQATLPTKLGWGSTEFHVVRPNVEILHDRYALHYLRTSLVREKGTLRMTGSAGQRRVPVSFLKSLDIPLPPFPEQRRIAAVLDEADALRTARRQELALINSAVDDRVQAIVASSPTEVRFGELLAEPLRNGISPSRGGLHEADVLTLSAITHGSFDAKQRRSDTFAAQHSADKLVTAGLHLICRGNGNANLVGAMVAVPQTMPGVAFPDTMIATRPSSAITSAALLAAWRSEGVREQIRRSARTTNGTYKVNQQTLAAIRVPVCTPSQQEEIAALEHERKRLTEVLGASSAVIDSLFASLQHRAFRGEL